MQPDEDRELGSHPRGTLALVAAMGVLYVVGWLLIQFLIYVPRGVVTN